MSINHEFGGQEEITKLVEQRTSYKKTTHCTARNNERAFLYQWVVRGGPEPLNIQSLHHCCVRVHSSSNKRAKPPACPPAALVGRRNRNECGRCLPQCKWAKGQNCGKPDSRTMQMLRRLKSLCAKDRVKDRFRNWCKKKGKQMKNYLQTRGWI